MKQATQITQFTASLVVRTYKKKEENVECWWRGDRVADGRTNERDNPQQSRPSQRASGRQQRAQDVEEHRWATGGGAYR
jgi:hypothetical protein